MTSRKNSETLSKSYERSRYEVTRPVIKSLIQIHARTYTDTHAHIARPRLLHKRCGALQRRPWHMNCARPAQVETVTCTEARRSVERERKEAAGSGESASTLHTRHAAPRPPHEFSCIVRSKQCKRQQGQNHGAAGAGSRGRTAGSWALPGPCGGPPAWQGEPGCMSGNNLAGEAAKGREGPRRHSAASIRLARPASTT